MGSRALRWLESQWPYAALLCAVILLLIAPVWYAGLGLMFTLIYLQIPVYMLHQFEEHNQDRFRKFANAMFGKEVFTPLSILVINSIGVWEWISRRCLRRISLILLWGSLRPICR